MRSADHDHRSKVVIGHGRAAAMEVPGNLAPLWSNAMRYGLRRVGYRHADCIPIDVPFYAAPWRPDEYLETPVFDSGVTAFGAQAEVESSKPIGDRVEEFAEVMYRYLHLSDDVLRILLKDVDEYFKLGNLRRAADLAIIDACISESEEVVLVGFSMGSIVGYHILANEDESFPVKSFVTCGSPLTDPAEWDWVNRLTPDGVARWPPCLRMWANIWDERDPATSHHDWSGKFRDDAGRVVQSARSFGRAPEPWNPATAHNPFDYLTSKSLAAAVATALRVLDP